MFKIEKDTVHGSWMARADGLNEMQLSRVRSACNNTFHHTLEYKLRVGAAANLKYADQTTGAVAIEFWRTDGMAAFMDYLNRAVFGGKCVHREIKLLVVKPQDTEEGLEPARRLAEAAGHRGGGPYDFGVGVDGLMRLEVRFDTEDAADNFYQYALGCGWTAI